MKIPTNFHITIETKEKEEQEELTHSEQKKYESIIDKLEKEIDRLKGDARRRN